MILSIKNIGSYRAKINYHRAFRPILSLGTNSYDVHLGKFISVYNDRGIDAKRHNKVSEFGNRAGRICNATWTLYLGVTMEYTETHHAVPFLEGKSSIGRLGIDIHATAGKGDVGFCNYWTFELSCVQPVRIYAGMPIGQLIYFAVDGNISRLYNKKTDAKYNTASPKPMESMMWKNKF